MLSQSSRSASAPVLLGVIVVAASVIYALVAADQPTPNLFPDEIFYGKLAQNLAFGHGMQWRGSSQGLPPLWPSVLSLAWRGQSATDGYAAAKTLGAVIASTTAIPTWFLARQFVTDRIALIPAVLAVLGVWMQITDFLASENLAYPLATASLALTVMAVADTRVRWIFGSLAFALLAVLTRTQLLVLPVILVLALVIDVIRQRPGQRRARMAARPRALWLTLGVIVAGGLLAFVLKPNLTHYDVLGHSASVGDVVSSAFHEGVGSIAFFGFIPVVAALALMLSKEQWRDEKVGALLATLLAAVLTLYPLLGRFLAWATKGVPVDRYVIYLAPLLLTCLVVAAGRVRRRDALVSAGVITALLLAAPRMRNLLEQNGQYGVQRALHDIGVLSGSPKTAVIVVGAVLAFAGAVALSARNRTNAGLGVAAVMLASIFVVQNVAARSFEHDYAHRNRTSLLPAQLDWVDQHANGDAGVLDITGGLAFRSNPAVYTEFFNRKLTSYYAADSRGADACNITVEKDGKVTNTESGCTPWPRNLVLATGPLRVTLRGEHQLANPPRGFRLVRVPAGAPRLRSFVSPPCHGATCTGGLQLGLFLDQPANVTVRFRPAADEHRIGLTRSDVHTLPAGVPGVLRFKVPAGRQTRALPVDWTDPQGAPELESVVVESGGQTFRAF